jgi:hypothetical protein
VPTCVLNNKDAFAASVAYDGDIGKCAVTCRAETGIGKATGSGQCNKVFLSAGMSFAANSNILVRDDVTLEYRNDRLTFKNTMSGHVIFQPEHGSGTDMNGYYVWGSMTSCGFDTDAGVILFKYTMFSISTDGFNTVTSALVTYSTSLPAGAATYKPFTLAITANHNLVIKDRDGVIAWIADEFGGHTDRRTYQDGEDAVGRDPSFVAGVLLDERYGGTPYESLCKDTYVYLYCKESPYSPTMASVSSVAGKCATSGKHCAMGVQSCGGGFNHLGTGGSGKTYVLSSLGQCELPP